MLDWFHIELSAWNQVSLLYTTDTRAETMDIGEGLEVKLSERIKEIPPLCNSVFLSEDGQITKLFTFSVFLLWMMQVFLSSATSALLTPIHPYANTAIFTV